MRSRSPPFIARSTWESTSLIQPTCTDRSRTNGSSGWRSAIGATASCSQPSSETSAVRTDRFLRSEEHTSELQSHSDLVCRLLLEKKKKQNDARAETALSHHVT